METLKCHALAPIPFFHIYLTYELDVVGHVHELGPLHHHLLPHLELDEVAPLHADGELGDPAEEEGG